MSVISDIIGKLVDDKTRSIWIGKDYSVADLRDDLGRALGIGWRPICDLPMGDHERRLFLFRGRVVDGYQNWGRIFLIGDTSGIMVCETRSATHFADLNLPEAA